MEAGILTLYPRWWFKGSSSSSRTPHLIRISCSNHNPCPLSPNLNKTLSQIQSSGVIACLRAPSWRLWFPAQVIEELVREHPTKTIGVGTVLNAKDAKRAIRAGAQFLMSPAMVKDVFDDVQGTKVLYIPGVMTPTEILCAHNAGAKIVKLAVLSTLEL